MTGGNVGIGDTSPSFPLVVSKSSSSTSNGADASFRFALVNPDQTNNNYALMSFSDGTAQPGSGFFGMQFTDHTNNYGDLCFGTRGASGFGERMRITSAGVVRIGPASNEIRINSQGTFENSTINAHIINANGLGAYGSGDLLIQPRCSSVGSNNIVFGTSGGTNTTSERMRITSDGMVGIGMTPSTAGGSTYMLQMYNPGPQCFLSIGNGTSGNGPLNGLVIGNDATNAYIINREATTLNLGCSDSVDMVILSGGNIGIGTTLPQNKLHVAGYC